MPKRSKRIIPAKSYESTGDLDPTSLPEPPGDIDVDTVESLISVKSQDEAARRRDHAANGDFLPGNQAARSKLTVDSALAETVSPHKAARMLWYIAQYGDPKDPTARLKALRYIFDRRGGAPRQMLTIEVGADDKLALMEAIGRRLLSGQTIDADYTELPPDVDSSA